MRSTLHIRQLLCFLLPLLPGKVLDTDQKEDRKYLEDPVFIWGLPIILPQASLVAVSPEEILSYGLPSWFY